MMTTFRPTQSVLGGLFIGLGGGAFMWLCGRVAGNSGALKSLVLGPREGPLVGFLVSSSSCANVLAAPLVQVQPKQLAGTAGFHESVHGCLSRDCQDQIHLSTLTRQGAIHHNNKPSSFFLFSRPAALSVCASTPGIHCFLLSDC
jgi:hypothetical protein